MCIRDSIKTDGDYVYIPFGSEHLNITNEIVDYIRMMSVEQSRSFLSGFLRGLLAKWLGNTTWLSAIQSAQAKSRYRIRIAYRLSLIHISWRWKGMLAGSLPAFYRRKRQEVLQSV